MEVHREYIIALNDTNTLGDVDTGISTWKVGHRIFVGF